MTGEVNVAEEPLDERQSNLSPLAQVGSTTVEEKEGETQREEKAGVSEDRIYAHPVHLTFLITMPDPATPFYHPGPTTTTSNGSTTSNDSADLPLLTLGTTLPIARLPSIVIEQEDLDSWWDLPTLSPPSFGRSRGGQLLYPPLYPTSRVSSVQSPHGARHDPPRGQVEG